MTAAAEIQEASAQRLLDKQAQAGSSKLAAAKSNAVGSTNSELDGSTEEAMGTPIDQRAESSGLNQRDGMTVEWATAPPRETVAQTQGRGCVQWA